MGRYASFSQTSEPGSSLQFVPEVIRLVARMCVCFSLSLRDVEGLLFEHGIDICHETVAGGIGLARCSRAIFVGSG